MFCVKLTTADMRKAVVNDFLSLPQSGNYSLRESFATLMKHSVRTQKRYYDEQPIPQKNSKALDLLASVASRSVGDDSVEVGSDSDEEGNADYLPTLGEFVALVAANSTAKFPEVSVGRVIRLTEDRKTAYLAEFSEEAPGKSLRGNVSALVYPINIVYLH